MAKGYWYSFWVCYWWGNVFSGNFYRSHMDAKDFDLLGNWSTLICMDKYCER